MEVIYNDSATVDLFLRKGKKCENKS